MEAIDLQRLKDPTKFSLEGFLKQYKNNFASYPNNYLYPDINNILTNYLDVLKKSDKTREEDQYQWFTKLIKFTEESYYVAEWGISKSIKLCHKHQISEIVSLAEIKEAIHFEGIDELEVGEMTKNEPIILLQYAPNFESIIIDGNHRAAIAYLRGEKEISIYYFPSPDHIEAMSSELSKNLYKVHNNLNLMANIADGNIKNDADPKSIGLDYLLDFKSASLIL